MRDRAAADRTAKLLLWFLREPLRYRTEVRRRDAPPLAADVVLKLALGRVVEFGDPAVRGESPAALRDAAVAYVRQVLFRPDATPYQMLGLVPGASAQAIKDHFRLLMQLVHPDRQDAHARWPDAFAARANRAYSILRNPESRASLDREQSERAARMHATQRKAEAAAATPSARWPARATSRRPLPPAVLPEWLTAGVGGFVRGHPAMTAFVALLGGAALVIGVVAWEHPVESLTRDARMPIVPAPTARDASGGVATASQPDASAPAADGTGGSPAPVAAQAVAAVTGAVPELRISSPAPALRMPANDPLQAPPASAGIAGSIPPDAGASPTTVESSPAPISSVATSTATRADGSSAGTEADTPATARAATPQPLTMAEIDALSVAFVDSYDRGRIDAFAALFDAAAETNFHRGRAAIRSEYDELFRLSRSRRMQLRELNWRRVGERAYAKGEIQVLISWRDGREVDQRVAVDIEVARRDGRVVITRLAHQPSAP